MADYYPLIARALEGLGDSSATARDGVYVRARTALLSQLRAVEPALGEAEIERERAALDEAIERAERAHGAAAAREARLGAESADAVSTPSPGGEPTESTSRRARLDSPQPIRRGGKRGRSLLVAAGLVAVITPIAVVAWLRRDQPAAPTASETARPAAPASSPAGPAAGDPKFPERVAGGGSGPAPGAGGGPAPGAGGGTAPGGAPPASPPAQPPRNPEPPATPAAPGPSAEVPPPVQPAGPQPTVQPDLAVAQKAALVEENAADPQQPKVTPGRTLWRIDALNPGQGQPLDMAVRATVDIPDAGLSLMLTVRKNREDATRQQESVSMNA